MISNATTVQRTEVEVPRHVESTTSTETAAESYNTEQSKGFFVVGDNLDKNFQPSH